MQFNFGGFESVSTIEYPDHAAFVIFFRGCRLRCPYCHNASLWQGVDLRSVDDIFNIYKNGPASMVSAAVFSGGECTDQPEPLKYMINLFKNEGVLIGLYTNGSNYHVLKDLILNKMVDFVSLDIKADWKDYLDLTGTECAADVIDSYKLCLKHQNTPLLPKFRAAHTKYKGINLPTCVMKAVGEKKIEMKWQDLITQTMPDMA